MGRDSHDYDGHSAPACPVHRPSRSPCRAGKRRPGPWSLQRHADRGGWTAERVPAGAGLEDRGYQVRGPDRLTIYLGSASRPYTSAVAWSSTPSIRRSRCVRHCHVSSSPITGSPGLSCPTRSLLEGQPTLARLALSSGSSPPREGLVSRGARVRTWVPTNSRSHRRHSAFAPEQVPLHIGQQRRDNAALRGALLGVGQVLPLQHARMPPFPDETP
jgi:hypothetical protein